MMMTRIVCVLLVVGLAGGAAFAQAADDDQPVDPLVVQPVGYDRGDVNDGLAPREKVATSPAWWAYVLAVVATAVVLAPVFKDARRSHLD
ncbi:MAG: hypothetical protein ACYS8X_07570 [Planctomycetota bacterium]|jgi:hypothetical protein